MALVVSKKLKIKEFEKWVTSELNGYENPNDIPDYRGLSGEVKAWNPFHGWQPVIIDDPKITEIVSSRKCGQTIAELESLLSEKPTTLLMPFSSGAEQTLRELIRADTQVTLKIASVHLVRIVDTVRTIILNWSMKLEEDGILGEDLSFSSKEQKAATKVSTNINNFYGSVHGPQIQQASSRSSQVSTVQQLDVNALREVISKLQNQIDQIKLKPDVKRELNAEIKTVEAQAESPKPKFTVIKESLLSIQRILEAAGGTVAGEILKQLIGVNFS